MITFDNRNFHYYYIMQTHISSTLIWFLLIISLSASEHSINKLWNQLQNTTFLTKSLKFQQIPGANFSDKINVAVETPMKIGSFNIQTLSSKKFQRPQVMSVVEQIILRYDLILILEIMLKDDYYMNNLLTNVNRLAPNGITYNMTMSAPHNTTTERSAFLYRTSKLAMIKYEEYQTYHETFYRKPFIVHFKSFTLRDINEFVAVGHHVKPNNAVQEINALADMYDDIKEGYEINDVLIMGDFNADCSYVKENDWENISLWTRYEFTWPILTHIDTTTNHRSCALDRFVFAGSGMDAGIIMSTAQPFRFQEAFGLTAEEARKISDHLPIEIQIRGKLSNEAERHLTSDICLIIHDNRPIIKIDNQLQLKVEALGFKVKEFSGNSTKVLRQDFPSVDILLKSVTDTSKEIPGIISNELLQGVLYKVSHGGLEDRSSYADLAKLQFSVTFIVNEICTALICSSTTIN